MKPGAKFFAASNSARISSAPSLNTSLLSAQLLTVRSALYKRTTQNTLIKITRDHYLRYILITSCLCDGLKLGL